MIATIIPASTTTTTISSTLFDPTPTTSSSSSSTSSSTTGATSTTTSSLYELNITTSNYIYSPNVDIFNNNDNNGTSSNLSFNFYYNDSSSPVFPSYIRTTSMVFCIIIMCLGVIGNVMVPIVIFKTKDMRNSTNIFLVNLSIADLMVLLVCTPTVLVEVNSKPETWVLGEEMCKAVPFVELTVAHASVLTILAISFERYYAICKPLKAGYICTKARASLICLLAWFIAAVFTSPILAITQYSLETYYDSTIVSVCFTKVETILPSLFFILSISIFFFLPLAILLILYALIAKTLMDHPNLIAPTSKHCSIPSHSVIKHRKQVVLMLGTVVLAFFVCLLPFRALTLWIIIVPADSIMNLGVETFYNILYVSRIMFHINSAINPILYNIMSSKFRGGFMRLCGMKVLRKKYRNNKDINRKNTFNTTSSTNTSSQHTNESFWNRYSHRNTSRHSNSIKEVVDVPKEADTSKNNNRDRKDTIVRISKNSKSNFRSDISYV